MSNRVLRLQRESGVLPNSSIDAVIDVAVIEAILDVPANDPSKLLASVATTLEEAVVGHLEAIESLKQPHQIILQTPALASEIKASAIAAGATGVAEAAAAMEALAQAATDDVSRNQLLELVGQCHAALQGYLSIVFERYLVRR